MTPKPAGKISEAELQKAVIATARARGWLCAHFQAAQVRPGRYVTPVAADGAGFPDCVFLRGERLVFAELKAQGKRPRPEQERWLDALLDGGHEAYCWDPRQWLDGTVDKVLR